MHESTSLIAAKDALQLLGTILATGTLGMVVAKRLGIPDVVLLLLVGLAVGPVGLGWVNVGVDTPFNQELLIFGACYILFDGGTVLRFAVLREVWITLVVIATIGVVISTAVVGAAAMGLLGLPVLVAALLGATIASTDPATLVPVFRQVPIRDRVAQTIMSESAFNDATGAILVFTLLGVIQGEGEFSVGAALGGLLWQSGIGLTIGIIAGLGAAALLSARRFAFLGEYGPLVTLMAVAAAYLAADRNQASGFMAVFVFGVMLGNREAFGLQMSEAEANRMEQFVSEMALIMRLIIFVLLGSQVDLKLIGEYWWQGLLVVLVLMFVARPLVVFLCAGPDRRARWQRNELLMICWGRETGVIPAALAGMLLGLRAPYADVIAAVTFIAVLVTILVQATSTPWLAKRLGLLKAP